RRAVPTGPRRPRPPPRKRSRAELTGGSAAGRVFQTPQAEAAVPRELRMSPRSARSGSRRAARRSICPADSGPPTTHSAPPALRVPISSTGWAASYRAWPLSVDCAEARNREVTMRYGHGDYVYELDATWGELPAGWEYGDAVGVRVDSQDRVYVFN